MLELALHMTRHAKERILMKFLWKNAQHSQEEGGTLNDRIKSLGR